MPFVFISALKDFKRRLKDPVAMLMWLGIPVLIGGLLSLVMTGGDSGTPKAKLLFVDQDDSFLTNLIAGFAENGGDDSMIDLIPVELEEGRRRIDAGEASALLVVPEGFGAALLAETPVELHLVTNPSQVILPAILEEGLEMLVEAAFYAQRVLGDELRALAAGPDTGSNFFTNAVIATQAVSINSRLQELDGVLFPPLIDFEIEVLKKEEGAPGGVGLLLFPGILFLAMLFIAQGMSGDLWIEKRSGTLQRVLTTPTGLRAFLFGKLLAGTLLIALTTALGLVLGALMFDFPLGGLLPGLLWGAFSGLVLLPLFMWTQILATSQQAGNVLSSVLLFPLMMLGGSLFPFEAMPDWMVVIGQWTPNGMAMANFKEILTGSVDPAALASDFAMLLAFGASLFLLTARRAAGRFLNA